MKKIITAINNPKLNEELKKEKNFKIIGKDIQYKEAILEVLEKDNNLDIIIISEKILGEINVINLVKKIKKINEKIKIIYILEKENKELEKILIKNGIFEIYYNNIINLEELIKILNKKEINMEEEIIKLKKIIEEKNINNKKIKIKNIFLNIKSIKNKIKNFKKKNKKKQSVKKTSNIISFSGDYKTGKSTLALIISQYLSAKNYKVILIDGDLEKQDLEKVLKNEIKKGYKNKKLKDRKIYLFSKLNRKVKLINIQNKRLKNKKNNINSYKMKKEIKNNTIELNKNLYFFNNLKKLLKKKNIKNDKILKKIIFNFFEILKRNYDIIIIDLSKNNRENLNKEILKNTNKNLVCLEPNILGISQCKKILEKYIYEWQINKKSIYIIKNKKNFISLNTNLISKNLPIKTKFIEIKKNKFYDIFFNKYYKRTILKNKRVDIEINKIIKKIILNKNL